MKTSRLTNKHFKNRNVQRFHRFAERMLTEDGGDNLRFCVWVIEVIGVFGLYCYEATIFYCGGTTITNEFTTFLLVDSIHDLILGFLICMFTFGGFLGGMIAILTTPLLQLAIGFIALLLFYKPPAREEIMLINPDGNPEMCKITKYPAIDFYGYRLPNAGDIGKIALFEEQRQKEEERAEKERQDEFNKTMFNLYCHNVYFHQTYRYWIVADTDTILDTNSNISPFEMVEIVKKVCEAGEYEISRECATAYGVDYYASWEEDWKRGLEDGPKPSGCWSHSQIDELTKQMIHIKGTAIEKIQKFLKSA